MFLEITNTVAEMKNATKVLEDNAEESSQTIEQKDKEEKNANKKIIKLEKSSTRSKI